MLILCPAMMVARFEMLATGEFIFQNAQFWTKQAFTFDRKDVVQLPYVSAH